MERERRLYLCDWNQDLECSSFDRYNAIDAGFDVCLQSEVIVAETLTGIGFNNIERFRNVVLNIRFAGPGGYNREADTNSVENCLGVVATAAVTI